MSNDRYLPGKEYDRINTNTAELMEMVQTIENWTGCFKVITEREDHSNDEYLYAIMGYTKSNRQPVYAGPCVTERALIWVAYDKLFNQVWQYAHDS